MSAVISTTFVSVWEDGAFGYIDLESRMAIEPQFDDCMPFRDGLAAVQRGNWFAMVDRAGRFVWGPTMEGGVSRVIKSEWV